VTCFFFNEQFINLETNINWTVKIWGSC